MNNQKSTVLDVLQRQFSVLEKQMNGEANSPLQMARKSAFKSFKEAGLPDRKNEEYKYIPLAKQLDKHFESFIANPETTELVVDRSQIPDLSGNVIVFINGNYHEELSNISLEEGLEVRVATHQKDLPDYTQYAGSSVDAYSGLNMALASSGVHIGIKNNTVIENPINIVHLINSQQGRVLSTPRHQVTIGENAQVTITELFIGNGKHSSFTNAAMTIDVAANSLLNHYKVGMDGANDLRVDNTTFTQQQNSVLNTLSINYGGKLIRNNLNVIVDGEYCETNLDGLYLPSAEGIVDNHTVVDHRVPNCNSSELYKGILGDHSTGVFNGKVFVRKGAQKTNAFQSNKNILLSDTATINTKPQLEIWADDVKCSHGCTTGQMDNEQLFYLRARGIDKASAQKLLLKAFAEEVISKIKVEKLRARVAAVLEEKLDN